MNVKKIISLIAGLAFIATFAVCPAYADYHGSSQYVAPPKDHGLISGTLDYLGSVVDVFSKGAWERVDDANAMIPRCCGKRAEYQPNITMNRGSRWGRRYK